MLPQATITSTKILKQKRETTSSSGGEDNALFNRQAALARRQASKFQERMYAMSIEQNKAIVRRIDDQLINQEQAGVIDETFAEDAIIHDPFMGIVSGREAFKQLLGMFD